MIRLFQKRLAAVYGAVRERIGVMLGAVAESVVGATVIRAYGVAGRTERAAGHGDRGAAAWPSSGRCGPA